MPADFAPQDPGAINRSAGIARVSWVDPDVGVMRHADAGDAIAQLRAGAGAGIAESG